MRIRTRPDAWIVVDSGRAGARERRSARTGGRREIARSRFGLAVLALGICTGCSHCAQPPNVGHDASPADDMDSLIIVDSGIDATDRVDANAVDASLPICDVCEQCWSTPPPIPVPADAGAGCGDGCVVVAGATQAYDGAWLFGERPGGVEYGGNVDYFRTDLTTNRTVVPWSWPLSAYCGLGVQSGIFGAVVLTDSTGLICEDANGFVVWHRVSRLTGEDCPFYAHQMPPLGPLGAIGPNVLQRVNGAWAWLENDANSAALVHVLHDGDTSATVLSIPGGDVISLVGGGDTLLWVQRGLPLEDLAISYAPFTSAHIVWHSGGTIGPLAMDAENPSHVVFDHSSSLDDLCAAGSDIYFFDLSTAETVPPRALTQNAITEIEPQIRGDRVAYLDFGEDTLNPGGCIQAAHSSQSLATTSVANGGRQFVRFAGGLIWLGRDRAWMPWGLNTAYQMLPPE